MTPTTAEGVDTRKSERRKLRFESIDNVLAEMDRIIAAEKAGTLRITGNWSAGKTFNHLAAWINYPYEGFPPGSTPPAFLRLFIKLMRSNMIHKAMRPGIRIPRAEHGTFGVEDVATEEGARRLRESLERLKRREPAKHHSPALGPMSDDDRVSLNLRHAELHLGFLHP